MNLYIRLISQYEAFKKICDLLYVEWFQSGIQWSLYVNNQGLGDFFNFQF